MADRSPHKSSGAFFIIFFLAVILIAGCIAAAIYFAPSVMQRVDTTPTPTLKPTEAVTTGLLTDNYIWTDTILESRYADAEWDKITSSRYGGFSNSIILTEHKTEGCGDDPIGNYIRFEGGLCQVGYWLEDTSGNKYDTLLKLKTSFAPVQSTAEAVSFAASTQSDLAVDQSNKPAGLVIQTNNGFLVQLVRKNTFGCGNHHPTGVIFLVTTAGEVSSVAYQVAPTPVPSEPELCVD